MEQAYLKQALRTRRATLIAARRPLRVKTRLRPPDFLGTLPPTAKQDAGVSAARQHLRA